MYYIDKIIIAMIILLSIYKSNINYHYIYMELTYNKLISKLHEDKNKKYLNSRYGCFN